jgi:hypothetical protein
LIVHHDGHTVQGRSDCAEGCPDWRADADMERLFEDDAKSVFPTGLLPFEWSPAMTPALEWAADQVQRAEAYFASGAGAAAFNPRGLTQIRAEDETERYRVPATDPPPIYGERDAVDALIPF